MSLVLSEEDWSTLKGEVLAKFEEAFDLETQEAKDKFKEYLECVDEDEIFEKLQGTYWVCMVEPGWTPNMFADADPDDGDISFVITEAMKKACSTLGIPRDILE